ncbi:MAG: hemerythrin family protein [Deltaproteobacteria bacterium]|jgi:hemerythrin|nr:hemerythrin family protein [Deltaproteobacteria bacterium]
MKAWKKSWNFDIPSIDNQHVLLLKAINALEEFLGENRIRLDINKLVRALNKYAKIHFSHEESLMKQVKFQQLEQHQNEHEEFIEKLIIFESQITQDDVATGVYEGFMDYLNEWFVYHLLGSDRKYVDLFKEHQIQ